MVIRKVKCGDAEPEQQTYEIPSEKEHLLEVEEVFDSEVNVNPKLQLDDLTVMVKLSVIGGDEEGRNMLVRLIIDGTAPGFFATRLFLKAIGEPYKGDVVIDTDKWFTRQLFATVKHAPVNGKIYANIDKYNFDKIVKNLVKLENKEDSLGWDE